MTKNQISPSRAPRRRASVPVVVTLWFGLAGLLGASCGDPGTPAEDTAVVVDDDDTAAAAEAVDNENPSDGATTEEPAADDPPDEPPAVVDAPWPASALPIAKVYEFDQRTKALESFGDQLFFFDVGTMYRIDSASGELSASPLVRSDEYNPWPAWMTKSRTDLVFAGSTSDFGFHLVGSIDPATFERGGSLAVGRDDSWIVPGKGNGDDVIVHVNADAHVLDTETMALSESLTFTSAADHVYRIDDVYWVWRLDGTGGVFDANSGDELSSFDIDRQLSRFSHAVVAVDDRWIWHDDHIGAVLTQFDRTTHEMTLQVDLSEHYGEDVSVTTHGWSDPESPFLIAQVHRSGEGWNVLIQLNLETGHVVSEHVISSIGAGAFSDVLFDLPEAEFVGGRLFVRDHSRRIVEVDLDLLGTNTGPWVPPGIEFGPVLDAEEQVIGDLLLAAINDGEYATTDPELIAAVGTIDSPVSGSWQVLEVVIVDDRAWSVAVTEDMTEEAPLTWRRVDGEWLLEADTVCLWSYNFGTNDCGY